MKKVNKRRSIEMFFGRRKRPYETALSMKDIIMQAVIENDERIKKRRN